MAIPSLDGKRPLLTSGRRKPVPNGVAFTGEGKLVREATGYEQEKAQAALSHIGFAGCASRASGAPLERIGDPQISPTRQISESGHAAC
jgi:hypothetical protein